jgi:drug/metabolite transporter (DMT)-like permease
LTTSSLYTLAARLWEKPLILLWIPPLLWSGNIVLGRAFGNIYPPVSLAVGRWIVALALLAPFVAARSWKQRQLLRLHWLLILFCGAFGVAGYNALVYVALQTTPAANVAFLNSTLPLMVPVAATILNREPIPARTIFGIVLSFAGIAWIVARGDLRALSGFSLHGGEFLVLFGVANYAIYSVLLRRKPKALDPLVFLAATMVAGLLVLTPFLIVELANGARVPFDARSVAAVVYIGLFASLISFILWNRCVATLGSTVTGISFHLVAVFSALLAFITLGERVHSFHLVGIALILSGFFLATSRARQVSVVTVVSGNSAKT